MSKTRLTREEFEAVIKSYEAAGQDVTELKKILAETYPPKPTAKISVMPIIYGEKTPIEYSEEIIDCDRNHTLNELRAKAKEAGLSTSGDKKALCTKLLSAELLG